MHSPTSDCHPGATSYQDTHAGAAPLALTTPYLLTSSDSCTTNAAEPHAQHHPDRLGTRPRTLDIPKTSACPSPIVCPALSVHGPPPCIPIRGNPTPRRCPALVFTPELWPLCLSSLMLWTLVLSARASFHAATAIMGPH